MKLILHHYGVSPYSEMIRLLLGHTQVSWLSAISPPMPPRIMVDPLVGGYRRIPVAQLGADLFCDTKIISSEIAQLADKPQLKYENCCADESSLIDKISAQYFMAIVQTAKPSSVLAMLVTRYWPWQIIALMRDRAGVAKSSKLPRAPRKEQARRVEEFRHELQERLGKQDFLFADTPSLADFAAYHLVWFADLTRPDKFASPGSKIATWQSRISSFGHGDLRRITKRDVYQAAKDNQPRDITTENNHALADKMVSIYPSDYARDSVEGLLVASDDQRYTVARETSEYGKLHVHFPVSGYEIDRV